MDGATIALLAQSEAQSGPSATDWIGAVASIVQSLALVAGGIWAYLKFVRGRLNLPRASLTQVINHYTTEDKILLHVNVVISNPGSVVLRIKEGVFRVQQVLPLDKEILDVVHRDEDPVKESWARMGEPVTEDRTQVYWRKLGERRPKWAGDGREIEPGETDEVAADFFFPKDVELVKVYTHFKNVKKERPEPIGWSLTTLHDLKAKQGAAIDSTASPGMNLSGLGSSGASVHVDRDAGPASS